MSAAEELQKARRAYAAAKPQRDAGKQADTLTRTGVSGSARGGRS